MSNPLPRHSTRWLLLASSTAAALLIAIWLWRRRLPAVRHHDIDAEPVVPETPSHLRPQDGTDGERGREPIQLARDGAGPLFHRRYRADIAEAEVDAQALMAQIQSNINDFSAQETARFEKTRGTAGKMRVGDEYYIHITGPWDGPVRVIEVEPTHFALATLDEHMEAGEIHFSLGSLPGDNGRQGGGLRFDIESWARSRDAVVDLAYDKVGLGKLGQKSLWTFFCRRVAEESGGTLIDKIDVLTEKHPVVEESSKAAPRQTKRIDKRNGRGAPLHERYADQLEPLADANPNFDREQRETFTEGTGWRIDDYQGELPAEPAGDPVTDGPWQTAVEIMRNYEFPDPGILTGIYVPDDSDDILNRVMLLRAKFLFFRFYFGVRISGVVDETRETELGPARVWGFSYYTLEGHWEQGEIEFTVWKYLETGAVEFRIHAYSKTGRIPNLMYRIGFALFGRWLQVRFSRKAVERMQTLVAERAEITAE